MSSSKTSDLSEMLTECKSLFKNQKFSWTTRVLDKRREERGEKRKG